MTSLLTDLDAGFEEVEFVELFFELDDFRLDAVDARRLLLEDVDLVSVRAHCARVLRQLQVLQRNETLSWWCVYCCTLRVPQTLGAGRRFLVTNAWLRKQTDTSLETVARTRRTQKHHLESHLLIAKHEATELNRVERSNEVDAHQALIYFDSRKALNRGEITSVTRTRAFQRIHALTRSLLSSRYFQPGSTRQRDVTR